MFVRCEIVDEIFCLILEGELKLGNIKKMKIFNKHNLRFRDG